MDNLAMLSRVVDETTRLVNDTPVEQYTLGTPCAEWTVRDLMNHITGGATMFAISAETGSVPDEVLGQLMGSDLLGDDAPAAWATASQRALAAFQIEGVLDRTVKLPFGEMPAGAALNIAIFDVATHACDLARATGQTIQDQGMLESALVSGQQMVGAELRVPGVFDAETQIDRDAPIEDRLLAFAGRAL